ncbi:hypothetical protein D3C85_1093880 [compost metagenome]
MEQADDQQEQQAVGDAQHQVLEGGADIDGQPTQPLHRHPRLSSQQQAEHRQGRLERLALGQPIAQQRQAPDAGQHAGQRDKQPDRPLAVAAQRQRQPHQQDKDRSDQESLEAIGSLVHCAGSSVLGHLNLSVGSYRLRKGRQYKEHPFPHQPNGTQCSIVSPGLSGYWRSSSAW